MKAKVKSTQQIVNVKCVDIEQEAMFSSWQDEDGGFYLENELNFTDVTDYKTWTENLIHDLAVAEFHNKHVTEDQREQTINDIVLFAYALVDRMMKEAKTWY